MSRKEKMKVYHGIPSYISYDNSVYIDFSNGYYGKGVHSVIDGRSSLGGDTSSLTLLDGITGRSAKFIKSNKSLPYLHFIRLNETFDLKEGLSISAIIKTKDISSYFNGIYAMYVNDFSQSLMSPNMVAIHRFLGIDKSTNGMDRISISAYKNNVTVNSTGFFDVPTNKYSLFQFIVKGMISYYYIDGELVLTQDLNSFNMDVTKFNCLQFLIPYNVNGEFYIERFIISKDTSIIPNCIPNDHKNGKAIIKPRMNQQQIKGDPLYSQVTELLVDSSAKIPKPYSNTANSDGTYTHLYKPELSVLNANVWNNTSKLKIKGLNGEIISGVIDTDTALCKVLKVLEPSKGTVITMNVSDTSKLSLQDNVMFVKDDFSRSSTVTGTVTSIDATLKQIQVTYSSSVTFSFEGGYLVESTASSSSPIVKSEDGTTVVGTWSGLGTNEATFTLGTNTDLSGKDLYVTYSLNIPNGNSDFPELPYSVDRAYNETGLEMKPVSEIVIEDDFSGKVAKDTNICPHKLYRSLAKSLKLPSEIKDDVYSGYIEYTSQPDLTSISKLDESSIQPTTVALGNIPSVLVRFDIISMIERKLGCPIPAVDKVSWIKANISQFYFSAYGFGVASSTVNKLYCKVFDKSSSSWSTGSSHSNNTIKPIFNTVTSVSVAKVIDDEGFVNYLLHTDACNGADGAYVLIDYVNLEVTLKPYNDYTMLFCSNKRAREDKCNPVLIQKETKTVKRYLPSKECFVTECSYSNPKNETRNSNEFVSLENNLASEKGNTLLTYGTGGRVLNGNDKLNGAIARLKPVKPSYCYTGENLLVNDSFDSNEFSLRYLCYQGDGMSYADNFSNAVVDTNKYLANNMLLTRCKLINVNGEVKLALYMADIINKKFVNELYKLYDLPNRPLIK